MTTPANALALDLRNLIATERPEGVKCCGICGKPGAIASKAVKELPHHSAAITKNLPESWRMLTKALGHGLMDFAMKDRYNAQLEQIRADLVAARQEHDTYVPEPGAQASGLKRTLVETLALIGVCGLPEESTPTALAERIKSELEVLMALKADLEANGQ